jgi:hypothetical protein
VNDEHRVIELLEELVAWARFANRQELIGIWRDVLVDPKHFAAYELSDGTNSQMDVASKSGLSQPTISGLWVKWRRLGLARDLAGRTQHVAKPSDLGVQFGGVGSSSPAKK